jgi:hypothetical protein
VFFTPGRRKNIGKSKGARRNFFDLPEEGKKTVKKGQ